MSVSVKSSPQKLTKKVTPKGGRKSSAVQTKRTNVDVLSNVGRARAAWGDALPDWVLMLASHCDASNQRVVGDTLAKSGGYISRILSATYTGSYEEAERLVRAQLGAEDVPCPLWGPIPLKSCMGARRQKGPPSNSYQRLHARNCPDCPFNTDRENGPGETANA